MTARAPGQPLRVAIYARYSSDQQREASIEDQVRICRARAGREGWEVVEVFADAAISGATTLRPGYQALLAAMREGRVDLVLAESLDRFSRDQEHIAGFYKQASYCGVQVITLAEGAVSELHIGLKGTMGALFLRDLADKTRRGLEGRVRAGRSAGAVPYGYRVLRRLRADGEPDRGLREPDPAEAPIVRRIFEDYAAGCSPRAIARALNEAGIPGPGGGAWFDSTIRGRAGRGDGLLRNAAYAGRLVWNRVRSAKDPVSGAERRRRNDPASHVVTEVPALRLIDDALWERVQQRLRAEAAPRRDDQGPAAFWEARRPRHLLTGKVVCGACGGPFQPRGRDYLGCKAARRYLCRNTTTVRRGPLEARVLDALARQLMAPALVAEFVAEFTAEWNRLAAEAGLAQAGRRAELKEVERQIANLVDAIADGLRAQGVAAKLETLEARRAALAAELSEPPRQAPALHPNLAEVYRARVASLQAALADGRSPEALEAARALVEQVIVSPPDGPGRPPGIELVGQLIAMLEAGGAAPIPEGGALASAVLGAFTRSTKAGQGGQRPPRSAPHPTRHVRRSGRFGGPAASAGQLSRARRKGGGASAFVSTGRGPAASSTAGAAQPLVAGRRFSRSSAAAGAARAGVAISRAKSIGRVTAHLPQGMAGQRGAGATVAAGFFPPRGGTVPRGAPKWSGGQRRGCHVRIPG